MKVRELSQLQKEYRAFFLEKLKLYGVKSPAELTKEKKSAFFTSIKQDWAKIKIQKSQPKNIPKSTLKTNIFQKTKQQQQTFEESTSQESESKIRQRLKPQVQQVQFPNQIIKSEPNKEQTDELKILFNPNNHFAQEENYLYPVVKMPKQNSTLKLPRIGRSNQKGYKEKVFFNHLKQYFTDVELTDNVHMVIPNFNKPYEPDIVLFDKNLNLYIDIEIDEPYDGFYRHPTHCINFEEEIKQDNIRDLFFTESGWIVIRFTEKQVHCQAIECIYYIKNILNSISNGEHVTDVRCSKEKQWDYNQCIQWQKIFYREKYLGIDFFRKQNSYKDLEINTEETESIESVIKRTKRFNFETWNSSVAFDEETHKYVHLKDETGNAEYISVTTLIERFFPFDINRYVERKAIEEERTEEEVLIEYLMIRDEASEKGTFLHNQIENFLKGNKYDSESKEFELFLNFYNNEIKKRGLIFFRCRKNDIFK